MFLAPPIGIRKRLRNAEPLLLVDDLVGPGRYDKVPSFVDLACACLDKCFMAALSEPSRPSVGVVSLFMPRPWVVRSTPCGQMHDSPEISLVGTHSSSELHCDSIMALDTSPLANWKNVSVLPLAF